MDSHLVGKAANAVALFYAFHDMVLKCGPPFAVIATKTMIVYRAARAFASVTVRNRWLDVELLLPRRHADSRLRNAPEQAGTRFAHKVRIAEGDLDRTLRGWICSACVVGQE